ncbi:DUF5702 domain-containing protein [Clostridium aminobutyricum]|uniref:Uncharacterized protein n=1 Tax=Clostridium aminobutyricum TaxID=33953 RepID=A0A939D700_CLOAM|nr:DUF5702 domain-containing protein [Clostridium aminobutyricum]MBN7772674.1 hypothetical protein [Clostridium aminobutyricum]
MLFICLMMVAVLLIQASASVAAYSYSDAVLLSAGKSILSEYHLALKESYGIMAFKSYEKEVDSKLGFYIHSSFERKLPGQVLPSHESLTYLQPSASDISCDLKEYALADIDVFETQIEDVMKYNVVNLGIDYMSQSGNKGTGNGKKVNTEWDGKNFAEAQGTDYGNRKLINQKITNSLPSKGLNDNGISITAMVAEGLSSWKQLYEKENAKFYVNEYALNYFNQRYENISEQNSFFKNEVEYILYGKLSDQENAEEFMEDFKALHFLLNSIHVGTDPQKRQEVLSLAEIMTPGPEAAITAGILAETWAYAETVNDMKLLESGQKVALIKSKSTWALTLTAALRGSNGKSYISPKSDQGYSYRDYLKLFLYFQNRETKLLRIMDLIQINLKMNADQSFAIKDCYVGLKYEASVNGQRYCYVQIY